MKKPAVFLDRDGVLVKEKSYITSCCELELFPYTRKCIMEIKKLGYYAICISNQSAVGRGMMSLEELEKINDYLRTVTALDKIYCCPHFWRDNKKICGCRKPETGLISQAQQDFSIDMKRSYMVGDRASDILCGERKGLTTVLLESGYGSSKLELPVTPDYVKYDMRDFVHLLQCRESQRI